MFHQYDNWPKECSDKVVMHTNVVKQLIGDLSKSPTMIKNYFIEKDYVISQIPNEEICLIVNGLNDELKKKNWSSYVEENA